MARPTFNRQLSNLYQALMNDTEFSRRGARGADPALYTVTDRGNSVFIGYDENNASFEVCDVDTGYQYSCDTVEEVLDVLKSH